tara:strand:- start:16711 stop:16851 length:141 start_codon:yes stop_codon:yes gene_type:complete
MKDLMKNIELLMRDKDVEKIQVIKVEDSKVELWEDGIYFGRQKVNY